MPEIINYTQSTHMQSIQHSISESVIQLAIQYDALQPFPNWLYNELNLENAYDQTIKRFLVRLECSESLNAFIDDASGINMPQVISLINQAIHDDTQRLGTLTDAKQLLKQACYECQRGYNLDYNQIDHGGPDQTICLRGTFHKLVECLNGIHPAVHIAFLSPSIASLKTKVVIKEELFHYFMNIKSTLGRTALRKVIFDALEDDAGLMKLWTHLAETVSERIFEEFQSLYQTRESPNFQQLISNSIFALDDAMILDVAADVGYTSFKANCQTQFTKYFRNFCKNRMLPCSCFSKQVSLPQKPQPFP